MLNSAIQRWIKVLEGSSIWIKNPQLSKEVLRNLFSSRISLFPRHKISSYSVEFLQEFTCKTATIKPSAKTSALTSNPALFSSVKADFSRSDRLLHLCGLLKRGFSSFCVNFEENNNNGWLNRNISMSILYYTINNIDTCLFCVCCQ